MVSLPNGSRFVFWRGSSYIPFWAGKHNTGACYEWAEMLSRPGDAVDCVEPLMDKELRYGRVEIVESTAARVHVRWTYQSTDLHYKVWGDEAVEDYYFYPDGFGTRVLTLKTAPETEYELSEFIILTPPGDVSARRPARERSSTPCPSTARKRPSGSRSGPRRTAIRARPTPRPRSTGSGWTSSEPQSAVYFNPGETKPPADRLRPVLRPRPDRHALLLGQPLAAGPGQRHGHRRSTTGSP